MSSDCLKMTKIREEKYTISIYDCTMTEAMPHNVRPLSVSGTFTKIGHLVRTPRKVTRISL